MKKIKTIIGNEGNLDKSQKMKNMKKIMKNEEYRK